jgi:hypothetical protein
MLRITAFVGTAVAASALGLAALSSAGAASAATSADDTFISVISDQGIKPPSAKEAIGVAHDVCVVMNKGGDLVDAVSAVAGYTKLQSEDAAFFVGASIAAYCPQYEDMIG